jgi:hypothetical protein
MASVLHQLKHFAERREVSQLRSTQRNLVHERNNAISKIAPPTYTPPEDIFAMVIAPRVPIDGSTTKELLKDL